MKIEHPEGPFAQDLNAVAESPSHFIRKHLKNMP